MTTIECGKPRVIRKVTKKFRSGNPREARDKRLDLHMAKVTAATDHLCESRQCRRRTGGTIHKDSTYAALTDPRAGERYVRGRVLPAEPSRYHPGCVPAHAKPLVRLLWPRGYEDS